MPNTQLVSLLIVVGTAVWVARQLRPGHDSVWQDIVAVLAGVGVRQMSLWGWLGLL